MDDKHVILAGHTRREAAELLGLSEVPVHVAKGLSAAKARAYRLADNRVAEASSWDIDLLRSEIGDLRTEIDDLRITGFDVPELEKLLQPPQEEGASSKDPEDAPKLREAVSICSGEIWKCGRHRVMCGDSHGGEIDVLMAGEEPDVSVVDPPFELNWEFVRFIRDPSIVFGQVKQMLAIPRSLYRFERVIDKVSGHRSATVQVRHRHQIIAQVGIGKVCPGNKKLTFDSIVSFPERPHHPHQKSVELIVEHLQNWTPLGEKVLDPYGGSGSTLIACQIAGRTAYVMEREPGYVDVILRRWEAYTGQAPERIDQ